ncbi:LysR family transcriptional regulator [Castellaniella daejeonensis]|jgi:DNA-binding transcriptional LysR family regulator|uniref:LysR family transcriptional regulator n=1 Tax=Castellaniella daejeonensis TaxID=659013 RepID=A0ABP3DGQ4_9BURK|nr:LysR family transcriptional regulator [Castellaniella sp.]HET8703029.1 LysR family transcriptional regulator [Castellaniella sp.]
MEVTLRQLRAFTALARTGGFTRAAESLHITQSALSGLIKELESQLGVRLVDRNTRRIQLSEVGREFHSVATRILRDLDGALENIDNLKRLRRGIVRIAAPQLMASTLIPEVIASFRREHPDIQVHLLDCAVENAIAQAVRGEVDVSIGPHREGLAELSADPLFDLPFMAVFPPGHPLESLKHIRWTDLVRYPLIALQGQFTDRLALDLYRMADIPAIHPSHEVAFMSTALSMVSAGLGVTAGLPYARTLVDLYGLRMRPLQDPVIRRQFFIYSRLHASPPPATQAFVRHLHEHVGTRDWRNPE